MPGGAAVRYHDRRGVWRRWTERGRQVAMFAARTGGWSRIPNALTLALERRRAAGLEVLDLTESNPTRCGLEYPREAILAALADPRALSYAPDPLGMLSARESISADYAARGAAVPPGPRLTRLEAASLQEISARLGVPIICDEVFGDFIWRDDDARQPTLAGAGEALVFVLNGLSKMLALPQVKLAWIAVGGPAEAADEAVHRLEIIADTFLSVGTPVQAALPALLALRPRLLDEVLRRVTRNRRLLEDGVTAHPACRCLPAEAGWGSVLQVPRTRSDEQWAMEILEHDGVLVHPGYLFDFAEEGH